MGKEKSQLKIGIILNYINMGLGNLIPIFYTPIMLSLLGQSEYGLYKLSSSVTSYLSLISLGIGSAVTRYLIKANSEKGKEEEEKYLGLFLVIFRIIACLSFIVGVWITLKLDIWYAESLSIEELLRMKILVFLMVCNMAISFSVSPYISIVNAREKFVFLQCMNIISTCFGPMLNLLFLWLGYSSIGMAVSSLTINIVVQICYVGFVKVKLNVKPSYREMPIHSLKQILNFSFWVFVSNVVGQLYNSTDTVMIGTFPQLATIGVAVYNLGGTFNSIMSGLATGVSNMLTPRVNKLVFGGASNLELTDLATRIGRIQGYIVSVIVTGFIAFGKPFISFYAGSEYFEAYWVAIFMMVPNMISFVQSVFLSIIVAKNRHKFRSIVYLGIAILNIYGTWLLIPKYGVIGAAFMTGLALVIGQGFIMNWYYSYKMRLKISLFWKQIVPIFALAFFQCLCTVLLSRMICFYRLDLLFIGIAIYTIIFVIANWILIMNDYEKSIIIGILKVFRLKRV